MPRFKVGFLAMLGLIVFIFRSHGLLQLGVIFTALAIHEISHCLSCRLLGYRVSEFKLTPLGGSLQVDPLVTMNPRVEAAVAAAGPIANLMMAGGVFYLRLLGIDNGYLVYWSDLNLLISLVNLIPAFPLDGGRILHAWLNLRFGLEVATNFSRRIALGIGLLVLVPGLVRFLSGAGGSGSGISLTIIGIFILSNYFSLKIPNLELAWRLSRSKKKFLRQKGFLCLKPIIVDQDTPLRVPLRRYGTDDYLLFYVPLDERPPDQNLLNIEQPHRFRVIGEEQAWEFLIAGGYHSTFREMIESLF